MRLVRGLLALLVVIFAIHAVKVATDGPSTKGDKKMPPAMVAVAPPPPRNPSPHEAVRVVDFKWSKGGFGTVALVTVTVANQNEYAVKDLLLRCNFYGASGTRVGRTSETVYQVVKAKAKRTLPRINMGLVAGQAASAACDVISADRVR